MSVNIKTNTGLDQVAGNNDPGLLARKVSQSNICHSLQECLDSESAADVASAEAVTELNNNIKQSLNNKLGYSSYASIATNLHPSSVGTPVFLYDQIVDTTRPTFVVVSFRFASTGYGGVECNGQQIGLYQKTSTQGMELGTISAIIPPNQKLGVFLQQDSAHDYNRIESIFKMTM